MKNIVLSFLAQRLDNQDPTHMELNQRPLAEGNVAERQELARQISEVSLDGSQVFYEESHAAFLLDDKFLLETPSDQLDDAGRIAPIVCYGRVPEPLPASWSGDVVKSVVGFAERIGRTISPKSQEIAGRGVDAILAEAEKKQDARNGKGAVGGRSLADHLRLSRGQVHHRDNATQKTSEESAVGSGAIGDRTSGAWDDLQNPFQIMRRKLKKRRHHSEPRPEPTHPTILRRHNMTDSTWPNEPQCRKTVLVLNQQDIDALRFEEGGADLLLNEQVYILPSSLKESNSVVQDLIDSGLVQPGAVLIQSPFDKNIYENSIQAVERFALAKYLHFSTLCMNLLSPANIKECFTV